MALSAEWLLANGLGGSASGTAAGTNTRTSHAHLIAAGVHGGLTALLLKLEERLHTDEGSFALGTDLAPQGPPRPAGYRLLAEFRLDPWPVWRFRAGGVTLEKSLFMVYGHNAVVVSYRHLNGPPARITVSPLIATRGAGAGETENGEPQCATQAIPGRVRFEIVSGGPTLTLWHNGGFMPTRASKRIHYLDGAPESTEAPHEVALVPGYLEAPIVSGETLHVVASAEGDLLRALAQEDRLGAPPPRTLAACVELLENEERARHAARRSAALAAADITARQAAAAHGGTGDDESGAEPLLDPRDPWVARLGEALHLGLVRRGRRLTLVSSLPAAEERGADAMRAVIGLIALRRFETAREVLRGYIEYLDEGLAPERFDPVDGRPHYGDPAAALWLVIAAERYARRSHDLDFARLTLYPALEGVMQFYRSGTRGGIRVDSDGLLVSGENGEALKRTELNALWHHATVAMAHLARSAGRRENGAFYLAWANEHSRRFNDLLWDEPRGCLVAALTPRGPIAGLDPSQLFAASLAPPLLPGAHALRLIDTIERDLMTPIGLRPSPGSAVASPGWLGPFGSAYLRAHGRGAGPQARVRRWLAALRARLDAGLAGLLPDAIAVENKPAGEAGPARVVGEPVSIVAAAELARLWLEELDHAASTAAV